MRVRSFLIISALAARAATAQAPTGGVSGVVYDSLAHAPLAGAIVQLVGADPQARFARTANADSAGRYAIDGVPEGRYTLGFFHPILDSLAVEPPLRAVSVTASKTVRADIGIASAGRMRLAICGARLQHDSGAVVVGIVRDAVTRAPAVAAAVTGEWTEYTITKAGFARRVPRRNVTTGENGWFALCDVPRGGSMILSARRGADSTDLVEVQVPAEGFVRRELYVGAARTVAASGAVTATDSASRARRMQVGDGRLSGTVVTADGARPVPGAQVSLSGGPTTRTNERGEWSLGDAPMGTRQLEVRAVSYYPTRLAVDVVAAGPPVRVALATLKSVLDTVRVTASRLSGKDLAGFEQRRTSGLGKYLSAADIARRAPLTLSDVFRNTSGVALDMAKGAEGGSVRMRGAFGPCTPAFYLDGHFMGGGAGAGFPAAIEVTTSEIDAWVSDPERIAGIEIYHENVPPQFQQGISGCGSIVIWTK